jgi:hypothetical protein
MTVARRWSEFETFAPNTSKNIWVDAFGSDWYTEEGLLDSLRDSAADSCVFVSPELHGRAKDKAWLALGELLSSNPGFGVCTDYPTSFAEIWCEN